jgi:hypothetical protein
MMISLLFIHHLFCLRIENALLMPNDFSEGAPSGTGCSSHPKMLYRVAAISRSVTEAGVFPF